MRTRRAAVLPVILLLAAQVSAEPPAEKAFATARDGRTLIHTPSGMRFPRNVGGFMRTTESQFDMNGQYVGVSYRRALSPGHPVSLRIAVVHIDQMTPRQHFIIARPMALRGVVGARSLGEGAYRRANGSDGYGGLSEGRVNGNHVIVGLWAFERGYWDIRARGEFLTADRKEGERAIREFVNAFRALDRQPRRAAL